MQHYKYYLLVFENYEIQLLCLLFCAIPMYFIGKIYSQSWIDPLRISLVFVSFANAVPTFLFFVGEIKSYLFYFFICSETSFWIGFIILASSKIKLSQRRVFDDKKLNKHLFILLFIIYLVFTFITYSRFGLPIFNESRIATYQDSGGYGIFARISPFISNFLLMYCFYQLDRDNKLHNKFNKLISVIVFLSIAITGILSGSKSAFLGFVFAYFGYNSYYKEKEFNFKKNIKYIPIILSGAFAVIWVSGNGEQSIFTVLDDFFLRMISTGDCYYMSYPNEIINDLVAGNSELFLFSNLLAPMRLLDPSTIPKPLGVQIAWIVYPNLEGLFVGPNSRHEIVGYVLYGFGGGIMFSFIIGILTSFLMFRLPSLLPKSFINSTIITFIYISSVIFITDVTAGIAIIFDIMLNTSILMILILIIKSFHNYSFVSATLKNK